LQQNSAETAELWKTLDTVIIKLKSCTVRTVWMVDFFVARRSIGKTGLGCTVRTAWSKNRRNIQIQCSSDYRGFVCLTIIISIMTCLLPSAPIIRSYLFDGFGKVPTTLELTQISHFSFYFPRMKYWKSIGFSWAQINYPLIGN